MRSACACSSLLSRSVSRASESSFPVDCCCCVLLIKLAACRSWSAACRAASLLCCWPALRFIASSALRSRFSACVTRGAPASLLPWDPRDGAGCEWPDDPPEDELLDEPPALCCPCCPCCPFCPFCP